MAKPSQWKMNPMRTRSISTFLAALSLAGSAMAQQHPHGSPTNPPTKALAAQSVSDLQTGKGMGMAMAAELNGYPGPTHVLENANALQLTQEQKEKLTSQIDGMRRKAIPLGEQIVAKEEQLEGLFKSGSVTNESIDHLTAEIAALSGELRAVHLRTHLDTKATLTPEQIAKYRALRGYDSSTAKPMHKH